MELEDESTDDENKAICYKESCKNKGGQGGKPSGNFYWLRCIFKAAKDGTMMFV